jgi:hypothetical protein
MEIVSLCRLLRRAGRLRHQAVHQRVPRNSRPNLGRTEPSAFKLQPPTAREAEQQAELKALFNSQNARPSEECHLNSGYFLWVTVRCETVRNANSTAWRLQV